MAVARVKFATQVDPEVLETVRSLAQSEGRQLQALVEEALSDLIEKRQRTRPRDSVMAAYENGLEQYGSVYQTLAK